MSLIVAICTRYQNVWVFLTIMAWINSISNMQSSSEYDKYDKADINLHNEEGSSCTHEVELPSTVWNASIQWKVTQQTWTLLIKTTTSSNSFRRAMSNAVSFCCKHEQTHSINHQSTTKFKLCPQSSWSPSITLFAQLRSETSELK